MAFIAVQRRLALALCYNVSYNELMSEPNSTVRLGGAQPTLYLVVDETPWRVHDADYRDFKVLRRQLGDPAAQSRYFVSQEGVRRVYQFKKQDDHGLQLATLTRQLSSAGWAARDRFDSRKVRPT